MAYIPQYLPRCCDGSNVKPLIYNALDYKKGILVTARNNDIFDMVADLAGNNFSPTHVSDDPLIYKGCAVSGPIARPAGSIRPPYR